MKIWFTKHFEERQIERDDWVFNINSKECSLEKRDKLEWKLVNRGVWYKENRNGQEALICVLNNLEVYCGVRREGGIIITTTYPYTKRIRRKLKKLERLKL